MPAFDGGSLLGKGYENSDSGVEVLPEPGQYGHLDAAHARVGGRRSPQGAAPSSCAATWISRSSRP